VGQREAASDVGERSVKSSVEARNLRHVAEPRANCSDRAKLDPAGVSSDGAPYDATAIVSVDDERRFTPGLGRR
jgi:hypothetical protein